MSHEEDALRPVFDNRWSRARKLLPNLKLRYPTELESETLSKHAKVNDLPHFSSSIRGIILDAHLNDARLRRRSIPKAQNKLRKIASSARRLSDALQAIDVGTKGAAEHAGLLLECELGIVQPTQHLVLIPEYIQLFDMLNDAACRAAQRAKPKRGPKGAGGNFAFDILVQNLIMAARLTGGRRWTNYRLADGTWTGTFLEALKILRPYLPKGIFPAGDLGCSVEHVRKKFEDYIKVNLALENKRELGRATRK